MVAFRRLFSSANRSRVLAHILPRLLWRILPTNRRHSVSRTHAHGRSTCRHRISIQANTNQPRLLGTPSLVAVLPRFFKFSRHHNHAICAVDAIARHSRAACRRSQQRALGMACSACAVWLWRWLLRVLDSFGELCYARVPSFHIACPFQNQQSATPSPRTSDTRDSQQESPVTAGEQGEEESTAAISSTAPRTKQTPSSV